MRTNERIRKPEAGSQKNASRCDAATRVLFLLATGFWLLASFVAPATNAQTTGTPSSIVNSKHNLSASGPGTVKATTEPEVCIFCHTPHNATPVQPLWNRNLSLSGYKTYTSNSLQALPNQPTGNSKLCLSCHDGTIALGSVVSRSQPIQMANGITTLPPGASNLGTDLSDDHPISFTYDDNLVTKNPKLKSPELLPSNVRLDSNRELQCTTCHNAHDNQYGKFLVMSNTNSELCNTCHTMSTTGQTTIAQHSNCNTCHQSHSAPSGPYLLTQAKVSDTCMSCHNGGTSPNQGTNVGTAINAAYSHDTKSAVNLANHIPNNSDCKDCHEPHTMAAVSVATPAPGLPASLGAIDGVSITGAKLPKAQFGYEVCMKCHGDQAATITGTVSRKVVQTNIRLQVAPTAVSFHPVAVKGVNTNVPSLRPPYTISSIIACTDCHGSDSSKAAGGSGANGPHGSTYPAILLARYETADFTSYSTTAYALCFNCHDNTKVVADSGPFPWHNTHVNTQQTPCSACHDSHGISSTLGNNINNFGLINFDTSIVFPDDVTHRLEFDHTGPGHGTCYVKCHGTNHSGTTY
jgi:predicted CXXCH cytochrome family protein